MHLVTPASLLPFTSPPSNLAAQTKDVCVCGDLCNCNAGIAQGVELIALLEKGWMKDQRQLVMLSTKNRKTKQMADLRSRSRRTRIVIALEELRAAARADLLVSLDAALMHVTVGDMI